MLGTIITHLTDVIALILLFGASIFIHEFGHFYAAIKLGLVVDVFSIGFGPAIWQRKIKGVVYKISLFPLGGYVALPQLDPSGMEKIQGENAGEEGTEPANDGEAEVLERELPDVAPWKRIVVSVAGPIGNIIFALVLALIIYWSPGAITYKGAPVVDLVEVGSPAEAAGLRAGDEVYSVNGTRVDTWYAFGLEALLSGSEKPLNLVVYSGRDSRELQVPVINRTGLPEVEGLVPRSIPCMLRTVDPKGVAGLAGLEPNDIVRRVGEVDIRSSHDFMPAVEPYLGAQVTIEVDRDGELVRVAALPHQHPVVVRYLVEGRAAALAGLQLDDRLVSINGRPVSSDVLFMEEAYANRGGTVAVEVLRGGELVELQLRPGAGACVFERVIPKSPAEEAGLLAGDQVLLLDGKALALPGDFTRLVQARGEQPLEVVVLRDGERKTFTVVAAFDKKANRPLIGVQLGGTIGIGLVNNPLDIQVADIVMPWMQEKLPLQQLRSDAMGIVRLLRALVDRREAKHAAGGLGGPVAIIATLWVAIKLGFLNALGFLRLLNVNLAILNLLPIPVLDGGHIVFATWEGITRRKVHPRVVTVLVNAFAVLLICAFLLLTVRDVRNVPKWFRRSPEPVATAPADTGTP